MNLVPIDHEALWTPARDLTAEDRATHAHTFTELTALMHELGGAGLSLPQIGLSLRGFVTRYPSFPLVCNPTYEDREMGYTSKPEGCLSKPGWHTYVRRPDAIDVQFEDLAGEQYHLILNGIEARVFLHEYDHLRGTPIFPKPPKVIHSQVTFR